MAGYWFAKFNSTRNFAAPKIPRRDVDLCQDLVVPSLPEWSRAETTGLDEVPRLAHDTVGVGELVIA